MTKKPTIRVADISEFRPQEHNANLHTMEGLKMLEDALDQDGYVAPMTAAADGEVIDGSARLETSVQKFGTQVLVIEHDGSMPIITKRVDIPDADTAIAKRIAIRANRIAQRDLEWDEQLLGTLIEDIPEVMGDLWSQKELMGFLDAAKVGEDGSEDEEDGGPTIERRDVPDAIWPSDNDLEIPLLDVRLQASALELPIVVWGSISRKARMRGTWCFYTEDYRYTALWDDPSNVVNSRCVAAFEPNFSCYEHMPVAVGLWSIYRKRWLSRYWQSFGIKVFADLNVAPKFYEYNLLGIPEGWSSWCTRGYSDRLDYTHQEYEMAEKRAGQPPLFVVYGGGADVKAECQRMGWLHVPEVMGSRIFRQDVEEKEEVVDGQV